MVLGIQLIAILSRSLQTPRYETADSLNSEYCPLWVGERTILCLLDHRYVELFYFFTSNGDGAVGFEDPLRLRWALPSCIIQPLIHLHRLFVVAQFVFVAFQGLMFVLTPISWGQVYSVDPCGYQHVAYGVGDIVSVLPSPQFKLAMPCSSVL